MFTTKRTTRMLCLESHIPTTKYGKKTNRKQKKPSSSSSFNFTKIFIMHKLHFSMCKYISVTGVYIAQKAVCDRTKCSKKQRERCIVFEKKSWGEENWEKIQKKSVIFRREKENEGY